MQQLQVTLKTQVDNSYPILLGATLVQDLPLMISKYYDGQQVVLCVDQVIDAEIIHNLKLHLELTSYEVLVLPIAASEDMKNAETKAGLEMAMFEHKIRRNALCIAIGGGVVGDLVGYLASTYMRGISYMQVPTTLLAMLDSSIGGKTGINTAYGKNLLGTFFHPKLVLMDFSLLNTLPQEQFVNGLIEAVKIFAVLDSDSFKYLQDNLALVLKRDEDALLRIVSTAAKLKAQVVEADEKEQNLRMVLNFGHTLGHAIEVVSNYKILHGFAVGIGMLLEARLAHRLGKLAWDKVIVLEQLLGSLGINVSLIKDFRPQIIAEAILLDKKNRSQGLVKCIILLDIGQVATHNDMVATDVEYGQILQLLEEIR